ncbi:DUF4262 domain-containing protein [Streptosporangium sp. NPDC051022]|uniref:DUF4262 domain-containing protein n=1 Tax=Streptosporangium sp. NPDC051022 TaxID=3155752 RepID=UPI003426EEB8
MFDQLTCQCLLCVAHDVELDEFDRDTMRKVRERGWVVIMVPEDEDGPGWAFTVGLWHTFRSPETAMFGLDIEVMRDCLNTLADEIAAGNGLVADQERDDVIRNYSVVTRNVDQSWYRSLFGMALHFYQRPPLPFMEVVWPDNAGRFPWDPRATPRLRELQPSLWIPKDDHAPGPWTKLP